MLINWLMSRSSFYHKMEEEHKVVCGQREREFKLIQRVGKRAIRCLLNSNMDRDLTNHHPEESSILSLSIARIMFDHNHCFISLVYGIVPM